MEQLKITESNYKFLIPRLLAFLSFTIMTVWNVYFLLFFNYQGNNYELFGLFQFLGVFIFSISFVLGIITISMPNSKIYSFDNSQNKFIILEKAAFADLYKVRNCFQLDFIKDVRVEQAVKQDFYNLVVHTKDDNSLILSSRCEKSVLTSWAEKIQNRSSDKFEIQPFSCKYLENAYLIFLIIQLLIYSDFIRKTLLLILS